MNYAEKWGKDVDEAVRLALIDLKLTIDQVEVIVLEESSKGFFGIGSKLAKVKVIQKDIEKPAEKIKQKEPVKETPIVDSKNGSAYKEQPKKEFAKKEKKEFKEPKESKEPKSSSRNFESLESMKAERPEDLVPVTESPALDFLKEVTEKMGLNVTVTAEENENSIYIDINGKDSGTVIGKRGQTLDAIQYLTRLVVNKDDEKYKRVVVDAENYRAKREKTLEQLAGRLAEKVVRTRKSVRLEPMNPYERKIIHATLQSNPKITTRSEGEEPYRRVIIEMK
ncbi:RNA-binding cell elongation regulator Jag/EloR [Clostridium aminobutyricum]|uniref:RNA-binding protein KhpB n=1 Tax=Clostridium aminobutyricum TaxID=33953 RepID=A0A939D8F0_CLOAM|nr:RNA-binding cell elongation regulator Jag/EloR [Clostridium aminobutyricum]MBN7773329.1 protein jag [Clostridium aminobutyricum]